MLWFINRPIIIKSIGNWYWVEPACFSDSQDEFSRILFFSFRPETLFEILGLEFRYTYPIFFFLLLQNFFGIGSDRYL